MITALSRTAASTASSSIMPAASLAASSRLSTVQRHLSTTQPAAKSFERMTVFGAGLMGAGIAQVGAQAGLKVVLADVTDKALQNGLTIISKSLGRVGRKTQPDDIEGFTRKIMANIETTTDPAKAVEQSDLVVEAILENLQAKRDLFRLLDSKAKPDAVFASNTSSLPIGDIAEACSEARQANFAGLHFFNPVPAMKLVEIIRTNKTSDSTFDALKEFTERLGKRGVTCKDTPGFIVNRLLVPYTLEAIRMLERGDATADDIDAAMELGCGYPMGPFKLLDFVGLDTTAYIAQGWREIAEKKPGLFPKELIEPSPLLEKLVSEGNLGRKSGKGFRDYTK